MLSYGMIPCQFEAVRSTIAYVQSPYLGLDVIDRNSERTLVQAPYLVETLKPCWTTDRLNLVNQAPNSYRKAAAVSTALELRLISLVGTITKIAGAENRAEVLLFIVIHEENVSCANVFIAAHISCIRCIA